jgi:hypothetical protein
MFWSNNKKDEIGFTPYHWKLFVLNGFGYAVDSLILLIQSIVATQAALEFKPSYHNGLTIAAYVGMLIGALFWGMTADIMGRKIAFNVSLVFCSVFAIVAGASPNWEVLGLFVCLSAFGAGGNLVLDTAVFLEYLPSKLLRMSITEMEDGKKANVEYRFEAMDVDTDGSLVGCVYLLLTLRDNACHGYWKFKTSADPAHHLYLKLQLSD